MTTGGDVYQSETTTVFCSLFPTLVLIYSIPLLANPRCFHVAGKCALASARLASTAVFETPYHSRCLEHLPAGRALTGNAHSLDIKWLQRGWIKETVAKRNIPCYTCRGLDLMQRALVALPGIDTMLANELSYLAGLQVMYVTQRLIKLSSAEDRACHFCHHI